MSSLAVAGVVALWGSAGLIGVSFLLVFFLILFCFIEFCIYKRRNMTLFPYQAIDRLPVIPGALELVGIGYTGVSDIT